MRPCLRASAWRSRAARRGVNGEILFEGKYDVIVLTNADPPNAEELSRALRALVRRAP